MVGSVEVEGETFELEEPIRWWSRDRLVDRLFASPLRVQRGRQFSPKTVFHMYR